MNSYSHTSIQVSYQLVHVCLPVGVISLLMTQLQFLCEIGHLLSLAVQLSVQNIPLGVYRLHSLQCWHQRDT